MTSEFIEAKNVVSWDLEHYKIPDGLTPCIISDNIKTALKSMGYNGPVEINAYCDETNQIIKEDDFLSAGIKLKRVSEGARGKDRTRAMAIFSGMLFWGLGHDDEPSNMMIIADNFVASDFDKLKEMNMNCNVILLSLSAGGMPIAHSGRSSGACSSCGIKIDH